MVDARFLDGLLEGQVPTVQTKVLRQLRRQEALLKTPFQGGVTRL